MPVWAFLCEAPVQLVGASRRAGGRDSRCAGLLPGGGLSFKHVLASPDPYMNEICRWHPDLLVIDLGTNDPAGADCTVPDVVNLAMRFLALVDNEVHPKIIINLLVLRRTSMGNRGDMSVDFKGPFKLGGILGGISRGIPLAQSAIFIFACA